MNEPSARRPEFTERPDGGLPTPDLHTKLLGERIVFLGTPIDDTSANAVTAQLVHLEHQAPDRDISLYINCPGGSFTAMTAIYDTMRHVTCDVETVCLGRAESAAAVLLAGGTPGKRSALPGARVLIRRPSAAEPVRGRTSDLLVHAAETARTRDRLEEMLSRHTGRSREQIAADIERDTVLDAPAAVAFGLVDRVVPRHRSARPSTGGR
ncbi:ATP-dependent Clp protease proteolytic subunit [Streptomyces sp. NPDC054842]